MRAIHLPGAAAGEAPPHSFPDHKAPAGALQFSKDVPRPTVPATITTNAYTLRVLATALCKGELGWPEILLPARFGPSTGPIPGHDVFGIVDTIHHAEGASEPKFKKGDRVWGLIDFDRDGAAADYVVALENEITLVPSPSTTYADRTSDASLASIPLSSLTAFQALWEHGGLRPPSSTPAQQVTTTEPTRLLLTGASGTVGLFTLQLAKLANTHQNIHVTAISSPAHIPTLKSLHCDVVLDYTVQDFTLSTAMHDAGIKQPFDLVIELAGGPIAADIVLTDHLVKVPGGRIVSISGPLDGGLKTLDDATAARVREKLQSEERAGLKFDFFIVKPDVAQLDRIGQWVSDGLLLPFVDQVFPLEDGREAMELVEGSGGKRKTGRGKIVLVVGEE